MPLAVPNRAKEQSQLSFRRLAGVLVLAATLAGLAESGETVGQKVAAKAAPLPDDLRIIPDNAGLFVTLRLDEFRKRPWSDKALHSFEKLLDSSVEDLTKTLGVSWDEIERITFLNLVNHTQDMALIVRTKRNYNKEALLGPAPRSFTLAGKTVYEHQDTRRVVYLASERVFAVGTKWPIRAVVAAGSAQKPVAFTEAVRLAPEKAVVVGVDPERVLHWYKPSEGRDWLQRPSRGKILDEMPAEYLPYRPLLEARWLFVNLGLTDEVSIDARLHFDKKEQAEDGETAVRTALYVGRKRLKGSLTSLLDLAPNAPKLVPWLTEQGRSVLKSSVVKRHGERVDVSARMPVEAKQFPALLKSLEQQALRQRATGNLRAIALTAFSFNYAHGRLFGPAIYDQKGKALLSWRVAILPYLGRKALYDQFKLDEAWDSPHNKKLLEKMPDVFAPVVGKTKQPYSTYYRVFTGPNTLFDPSKAKRGPLGVGGLAMASIPDGTSNTILIAEAAESVPWTKPEELPCEAGKPIPKLGAQFAGVLLVATADAGVRLVSSKISEQTLRNAIDPSDGQPLGSDW